MKVDFEVQYLGSFSKDFEDKNGNTVSYLEHSFSHDVDEGTQVFSVNSKTRISAPRASSGLLSLDVDPAGKRKTKFISFVSGDSE